MVLVNAVTKEPLELEDDVLAQQIKIAIQIYDTVIQIQVDFERRPT